MNDFNTLVGVFFLVVSLIGALTLGFFLGRASRDRYWR
jgi:hypothetical protein